ncbi:MAG TPA: mechanosensitive ion channel domain-containing protein [Candidatus Sulfotelmatobacter sp.]|nr:mechanosensitive ion channel domain-containing protein [Candidatus Sulfotelmatobacter sp.]
MAIPHRYVKHKLTIAAASCCLLWSVIAWSQAASPKDQPAPAQPEAPKDALGRGTPRGAVMGFITAARKGNTEVAALYLNTPLRGEDSQILARQLAAVLDQRLPARLNQISDKPEGSVPDSLKPDEDVVGVIQTAEGDLEITVERVDRGKLGKVWLFSRETLARIPKVFQELTPPAEAFLPEFMVKTRVAGIPLFEWVALFVGMPFLYLLTGLLNRALAWTVGTLQRRLKRNPKLESPQFLRVPIRLLLVAAAIYFLVKSFSLPLLARQFWLTVALFLIVVACVWWLLLLNSSAERYLLRRRPGLSGSASVLRLSRRMIDGLLLFAALLFILYHFGVDLTAALAGLGVGGIAVALAAQKTLENVIGGVSLIADQAVRVGDFLNLGDIQGTVEDVGLRSTRIRTLDRTVVSLPNGQIASMRLETLSVRDKFWFHPILKLRYETTPAQLQLILSDLRAYLDRHPKIEPGSGRVRFIGLGAFSFDVELFAYVAAIDWANFLEIQEGLLFEVIDIVHKAGAALAIPSQMLHVADSAPNRLLHPMADAPEASDEKREALGNHDPLPRAV